ncbi:MAG: hypothetical protein WDN28_17830 [Chthoniobacter sp.]
MKKWFSNLKVSQKLMLISVFFVLPDSVMLYLFITAINDSINFARMEQKGNQYQRPLEELLELIPQHRQFAQQALDGEPHAREAMARKAAQIDAAFQELKEVDGQIGAELQFTDEGLAKRHRENYRVQTVSADWQQLKEQGPKLDPATCARKHLDLIAAVRTMITHAGDTSNLILDPDLDSYYLMDATLLALPQTQDRIAAVMASGEAVLKQPYITPQDPPAVCHLREPAPGSGPQPCGGQHQNRAAGRSQFLRNQPHASAASAAGPGGVPRGHGEIHSSHQTVRLPG